VVRQETFSILTSKWEMVWIEIPGELIETSFEFVDLVVVGEEGSVLSNGCRFVSSTLLSQQPIPVCLWSRRGVARFGEDWEGEIILV
jgi:hypothetical protein